MKLTAFTVCTPEYTFEEVAKMYKEIGLDAIEIRVANKAKTAKLESEDQRDGRYWSHNICTVSQENITQDVLEAKLACDKYGIKIISLSSGFDCSQKELIKELCEAAGKIGCPFVRVWSKRYDGNRNYHELLKEQIEETKIIEKFAKQNNVKLLFEIHMGIITSSASAMYQFVSNFSNEHIGVIYDPGNMTQEGYEQFKMGLEMLEGYIDHIHIKNGRWEKGDFREDGTVHYFPMFCEVDEGYIDMRKFIKLVKQTGYDGYFSLEDFSNTRDTKQKLEHYINFMRSCDNE